MSELNDMILPVGLVLLGAYVVSKVLSGQQSVCGDSDVSQTCVGPVCWSSCTKKAAANQQSTAPHGADMYGTPYASYPVGSINIGLPAGPGNVASNTPCGPLDWVTRWQECGFAW